MSRARKHHFVPAHLLSNFAEKDTNQLWCYDKVSKKKFRTVPQNLCSERDFHAFETEEVHVSFENWITEIENVYLPTLRKVIIDGHLRDVTHEGFLTLCTLIAFQYVRTRGTRNSLSELQVAIHARASRYAEEIGAKFHEKIDDENDLSINSVPEFAKHIMSHHFMLLTAPDDTEFWISDDPVVMHNDETLAPYGNIGFGVPFIQIYLPISSKLTLAFWDRAVVGKMLKDAHDSAKEALKLFLEAQSEFEKTAAKVTIDLVREHTSSVKDYVNRVVFERRADCTPENVSFINALQLRNAQRQIICKSGRFDELELMLEHDPSSGEAPTRFTIG